MSENTRGGKNGKIELLRFIFAVIIVIHHFRVVVGDRNSPFLGGSLAVEFFFILSGYLMMVSLERLSAKPVDGNLGSETVSFLFKKAKAVYPEMVITYFLGIAVYAFARSYSLKAAGKLFANSVWELLFLQRTGLGVSSVNGVTWYIGAMLLCMAVMYPILRRYPNMGSRVVIPLLSLLALGWLCQNYTNPRGPGLWVGLTFKGNIRAFGELGLGVICYQLTAKLKKLQLAPFGKAVLTALEPVLYIGIIAYMYFEKATNLDYFFILLLVIALCITFSDQPFFCQQFNSGFFLFLGRFSVPLFFGHVFWAYNVNCLLPADATNAVKMAWYLSLAAVTAVVVYGLTAGIRRGRVADKIRRVFVAQG